MKLISGIMILGILQVSAAGYAQKLTLKKSSATLEGVFEQIRIQSGYKILCDADLIKSSEPRSVNFKNATIEQVLSSYFPGKDFTITVINNTVVIKRDPDLKPITEQIQLPPPIQITGNVTDSATGESLIGVTVQVKGSEKGTTTDGRGNFSLSVADDAVLVVSYVGYQTQEIPVNGKNEIKIILRASSSELNQLVVIGYGTQKKVNLTGSISTLDPKELSKVPVPNLSNAIAGQIPGVIVNSPGGEPGADDAGIYIRGKGTLGSTSPLVVIDGVPSDDGFNRMNPEDIESFSVLKDASAAIYGARAANGVILITTKRGVLGKPTVTASANVIFSQPTERLHLLDSWQEAVLQNESKLPGEPPQWSDEQIQLLKDQTEPLQYPNTDWPKILLKDWTKTQNYNLSVRGGAENIKYFVSGQYLHQDGVFKGTGYPYDQVSLRTNLDVKITSSISLGLDLLNRRENRNFWDGDGSPWNYAKRGGRYLVAYFPDGRVGKGFQPGELNAAESVSSRAGFNKTTDNLINSKITLNWKLPVNGFTFTMYGSINSKSDNNSSFFNIWDEWLYDYNTDQYTKAVDATKRKLSQSKATYESVLFNAKLSYQKKFGLHSIDAFIAYEQNKDKMTYLYAFKEGLPSAALPELFTGESNGQTNTGHSNASGRINYFGRINYNYKEKYLATVSLRRDGSQNFPPGKRYGTFPGVSVGWRISEEPFFKGISAISNLKLRASWGQMGNDAVPAFQYLTTYRYTDYTAYEWGVLAGYDYGNGTLPGIFESTVANPNITWETATTSNIGLDGDLFGSKLGFELDFFYSRRKNILIARHASVPEYTGLVLPDENLGRVNNRGFEISLDYKDKINRNLSYSVAANLSYAHNEVEFYDEPASVTEYQKYEGRPIDSWLLYDAVKIYETQDEIKGSVHGDDDLTAPGDIWVKDLNGDGAINSLDMKRINYGRIPEIMYGINLGLSYKKFDLSILLQGQAHAFISLYSPMGSDKMYFENRWQNGESIYPRINGASSTGTYGANSTFWLRKADFLRFKNVSLSYDLPLKLLSHGNTSDFQLYLRGNNLFLISDHIEGNWKDPEGNGGYPIQRSVEFGVRLKL
ncbi:MAG TPA: TonB-dependent receptor [Chitinophagaceae bacterium]|nr:TonB-dependent receptor [Chitinophagaceae bacterium]